MEVKNLHSKSKVKFDSFTVRAHMVPVLKEVEVEIYPAKIGRTCGSKRRHVAYYVPKHKTAGLTRL